MKNKSICKQIQLNIAKIKYSTVELRWCRSDPECGGWDEVQSDWEDTEMHSRRPSDEYLASDENINNWVGYRQILCWQEVSEDKDGNKYTYWYPCPNWPTDISAAWGLVDDSISAGYEVYVTHSKDQDNQTVWWCLFGNDYEYYCSESDTAQMAISQAWLAWKESE